MTSSSTPIQVKGMNGVGYLIEVVAIASNGTSAVVKSDGTVWTWGDNEDGQLGDGTRNPQTTPVQTRNHDGVSFLTDVAAVACGTWHTVALKTDGTVWAWGNFTLGQLGNGQGDGTGPTYQVLPVQVKGPGGIGVLQDIVAITAGGSHTVALKGDGTVWAWGLGHYLGVDSRSIYNTPVQVKGPAGVGFLTGIVAIRGNPYHTVALKSDGTVWAWGYNEWGQLGDGTTEERLLPVQVKGPNGVGFLTDVVAISGGSDHTAALKSDGTV